MNTARLRHFACAAALVACGVAAAPASAANTDFNILAGDGKTGEIDLLAIGPYLSRVDVFEQVGAQRQPLRSTLLTNGVMLGGKLFGNYTWTGIARWRCDRRTRTFVATATTVVQTFTAEATDVKSPSCSKRFKLAAPIRAKPGRRIKVTVEDTFKLGDMKPRICVTPPKQPRTKKNRRPRKPKTTCRTLGINARKLIAAKQIRVKTKGTWKIQVRTAFQRTTQTVAVGVKRKRPKTGLPVLLVGDSMMSQLVTPIADRLERKADVDSLLRGGGRLTETGYDWVGEARRRAAALKPRVAVVLIGAGDGFPIRSGNATVQCCDEPWIQAYTPYVVRMMQALGRGGKTKVVWGLSPAASTVEQRRVQLAVNTAGVRARAIAGATGLVDLNTVLSPGFVYAEFKTVNGRSYKIRSADGIHFTLYGAALAGNFIADSITPLLR
jgi:hypothetical protein